MVVAETDRQRVKWTVLEQLPTLETDIEKRIYSGKLLRELKKSITDETLERGIIGILRRTFDRMRNDDSGISRPQFAKEASKLSQPCVSYDMLNLLPDEVENVKKLWSVFSDLGQTKQTELSMLVPEVNGRAFIAFIAGFTHALRSPENDMVLREFKSFYRNPYPDEEFPIEVKRNNFFLETRSLLLGLPNE